jgi:hypothetical protein
MLEMVFKKISFIIFLIIFPWLFRFNKHVLFTLLYLTYYYNIIYTYVCYIIIKSVRNVYI